MGKTMFAICFAVVAIIGMASADVVINEVGPSSGQAGGFVELYNWGDSFQLDGWTVSVQLEDGSWMTKTIDCPEGSDDYLYVIEFPREEVSSEARNWRRVTLVNSNGDLVEELGIPQKFAGKISSWESHSRRWTGYIGRSDRYELNFLGWGVVKATPYRIND